METRSHRRSHAEVKIGACRASMPVDDRIVDLRTDCDEWDDAIGIARLARSSVQAPRRASASMPTSPRIRRVEGTIWRGLKAT